MQRHRLKHRFQFTLGFHLGMLLSGAIIPISIFVVFLTLQLLNSREEVIRESLLNEARELALKINAEVQATVRTLKVLGSSESLQQKDLKLFYQDAVRVLATQPTWLTIILFDQHGTAVLNAAQPFGEQRKHAIEGSSLREALRSGSEVVGTMARGPDNVLAAPVRIPLFLSADTVYVLTAVIRAESLQEFVQDNHNSSSIWTRTIVDQSGIVVARSRLPEQFVGTKATPSYLHHASKNVDLVVEETTLDHQPVLLALSHSKVTKWTAAVAGTRAAIYGPSHRTLARLAIVISSTILIIGSLAFGHSLRISKDIRALSRYALSMGSHVRRQPFSTTVTELDTLFHSIEKSRVMLKQKEASQQNMLELLHTARNEAEEANEAKDRFLAMLGHELRNPMGALSNAVEILTLLSDPKNEDIQEALQIMVRQTALASGIMNDLLDVSRISRGKIVLKKVRLDLAEIFDLAVLDNSHLFEGNQIAVRTNIEFQPVWIDADRGRLIQCINNVLHNAHKLTPVNGSVEVSLSVDELKAYLQIADTGRGFEPEMLSSLFEPFAQSKQDYARSQGGLGLGLAVVKGLVELHGGNISARNRVGQQGAELILTFPRAQDNEPGKSRGVDQDTHSSAKQLKILLVEDNPDAAKSLCRLLELDGHTVQVVCRGEEAVPAAGKYKPDVIICDLGLPGIDGFEVCRLLRNENTTADKLIIALSGYALAKDLQSARRAGFDSHLNKPVDLGVLRDILASQPRPQPASESH